jgi:hypothetical protein
MPAAFSILQKRPRRNRIQCALKPARRDAAKHDGIEHVLSRPVSPLAHGVDPGLR